MAVFRIPLLIYFCSSFIFFYKDIFAQEILLGTPNAVKLNEGTSLSIPCIFSPNLNNFELQWKYPNMSIVMEDESLHGIFAVPAGNSLILKITDAQVSLSGDYTCVEVLNGLSQTVTVIVEVPTSFANCPTISHPTRGQASALLSCELAGSLPLKVMWTINDLPLSRKTDKFEETDNGLMLYNVSAEHDGNYVFSIFFDDKPMEQRVIRVETFSIPEIVNFRSSYSNVEGQSVTLVCNVKGYPTPTVHWYNVSTGGENSEFPLESEGGENSVTISSLSINEDGKYMCVASNGNELNVTAKKTTTLNVWTSPRVHEDVVNISAKIDSSSSLFCSAFSKPKPSISWQKILHNGKSIVLNTSDNMKVEDSETAKEKEILAISRLILEKLRLEDRGTYECVATNNVSTVRSRGFIIVEYGPLFVHTPAVQYYWENSIVNITCHVEGYPTPNVKFSSLNPAIKVRKFPNGLNSFEIDTRHSSSNFSGVYECSAWNKNTDSLLKINVKQAYPPSEPFVNVIERGPTWLKLNVSMRAYDGPRIESLQVTLNESRIRKDFQVSPQTDSSSTLLLENLTADTEYVIVVSAVNAVGIGMNATISLSTKQAEPPEVKSLEVKSEPFSLKLHWNVNHNGAVVNLFGVRYRHLSAQPPVSLSSWVEFDAAQTSYIIKYLEPSASYEVSFRAKNRVGWADPIAVKASTLPGDRRYQPRQPTEDNKAVARIVGVCVFVFIVILCLVVLDVYCYRRNQCGLIMCVCVNCCGLRPQLHYRSDAFIPTSGRDVYTARPGSEDNDYGDGKKSYSVLSKPVPPERYSLLHKAPETPPPTKPPRTVSTVT